MVISGCSGGGKSTLLQELHSRGYQTVSEPGRRAISEARVEHSDTLPWLNPERFLNRIAEIARKDLRDSHNAHTWVFIDRGLIDAESARAHVTGTPLRTANTRSPKRRLNTPA